MSLSDEEYQNNDYISKIELIDKYMKETNKTSTNSFNFFLRTGRPGHLFLQPNYTAFTKTNLGSIPSKLEKTLIKTDLNKPLTTYINNRITKLNNKNQIESLSKDEGDISKYSTSFSSKGFGVGFVSKVNRFKDNLSGYQPGPADYSPDKYMTLLSNVEKSPFGKSLFKKKTSASLMAYTNENIDTKLKDHKKPNLKKKAMINITDDISNKGNSSNKKMGSYFFTSTSNRFNDNIFSYKNLNPGPGKYFFINDGIKIKDPENLSSEFVLPPKKQVNPINFFNLNKNDKKAFGFRLTNNKKGKINSLYNKPKFNTEENLFNKYEKVNSSLDNNSTIFTSNINNNNSSKIPSIYFNENLSKFNNSLKTEYISMISKNNNSKVIPESVKAKNEINKNTKKKLSRFKKRDHFSLSPPRWDEGYFHDNESHFQVPGPAYYAPPIQNTKKSFNLNNKDFFYTNSLPFKNDNYGSCSSVLI